MAEVWWLLIGKQCSFHTSQLQKIRNSVLQKKVEQSSSIISVAGLVGDNATTSTALSAEEIGVVTQVLNCVVDGVDGHDGPLRRR
jgi:hypothetical protein